MQEPKTLTTKINPTFKDHVTSVAFNISLSSNMIAWLAWIKLGQKGHGPNANFCNGFDALHSRGLMDFTVDKKGSHKRFLTPAGEKVYELLEMAGLV